MNRIPLFALISLLAASAPQSATLATTAGGREVAVLTVVAPNAPADRPALLLVGGLRGDEPASVAVVEAFMERLAAEYGEDEAVTSLLDRMTVLAVPSLNPDGLAAGADWPSPYPWNARPWDDDRDGRVDEDPPTDRNNDGVIGEEREAALWGMWREVDAPEEGEEDGWLPTMVEADLSRGEVGGWLWRPVEGADADGDGAYAEDGPGGISLDRNFVHGWAGPNEVDGGGPNAMSEAESRALADFLLAHNEVAMVVVVRDLGGGLGTPYAGSAKMPSGDKDAYEALGEGFAEATTYDAVYAEAKGPESHAHGGSLLDWVYGGVGRWAFAPGLWSLPDDPEEESAEVSAGTVEIEVLEVVGDEAEEVGAEAAEEEPAAEPDRFPKAWHQIEDSEWAEAYGYLGWTAAGDGLEAAGWPLEGRLRVPAAEIPALVGLLDGWLLGLGESLALLRAAVVESERLGPSTVRLRIRVWNQGRLATDPAVAGQIREAMGVRVVFPEGLELLLGQPEVDLGRLEPGEGGEFIWIVQGKGELVVKPTHPRSLAEALVLDLSEVGS